MEPSIAARLEEKTGVIAQILAAGGAPGLSIGVFHHGKVVHTQHFGQRDVVKREAPNDDTIYGLASLTKLLTTCSLGIMVSEGLLDWDTPVRHYLPSFSARGDDVVNATLRDLASNRTGLSASDYFWGQQNGTVLLRKEDLIRVSTTVQSAKPFRASFVYSVWNYTLIQAVMERVTGKAYAEILKDKILSPLGITDITFGDLEGPNIALPTAARSDGGNTMIPPIDVTSDNGLAAPMGAKGSVKDIMKVYAAILSAFEYQKKHGVDSTPNSPFTQLRLIFTPHIPRVKHTDINAQAYCLGVYRTVLPGSLSCASLNAALLNKDLPVFGEDLQGLEVIHHTGNLPGCFNSMFLLPETNSGVVCLSNATPLMDPTDFAAQMLLGVLLGVEAMPDYLALARKAQKVQTQWYNRLARHLESHKTSQAPSLPLAQYEGTYMNGNGVFRIEIKMSGDCLSAYMQGSRRTTYDLLPYDGETFYWKANRDDEVCAKGMFPSPYPEVHLVRFHHSETGIESLSWQFDMSVKPEKFWRREACASFSQNKL
ncbi:beta-lactamase/transpeptidase-like protein [Sporormia fimetaria CBS 119925]|uniref:Beta-lactamase/transpeptidase-like protein n=1 Tax=Sporormia fimetaria CBS 119925 TaxID=1340428 RepID=A0A6A6UX35_9PLEO|nr:beta-lactamase/transpeptidase-like protein [Sporormia fimetaria CBS 119925]